MASEFDEMKEITLLQRHRLFLILGAAAGLSAASSEEIRALLSNRVDEGKKAVGIVVGTISADGREIIATGKSSQDGAALTADSIFEIGSITKVFTSLLLADMVERGELMLETPVAKLLPESVKLPTRNGKQITLLDLSMQVSGLLRMPGNFKPANPGNPYADYDAARLYEFLSGYSLTRDIGEKYEYSNLGVGLLGTALARRAGLSYEALSQRRVLKPLGMTSTTITLNDEQRKRLASGHDPGLSVTPNWGLDALAGAGAIRSTTKDVLTFLAAHIELTDTPLKNAMRRMRAMSRPTGTPELDILMGWRRFNRFGTEIVWHNGGTGGYRTWAGFVPGAKKGVVVLCNTFFSVDDIGLHLLEDKWPPGKFEPAKVRVELSLDPKILAAYAGEYVMNPRFSIVVTPEGGQLFLQATNQPRFEAFATAQDEFFLKIVDAQISFGRDETGKVTHLTLHQNGAQQKATKK